MVEFRRISMNNTISITNVFEDRDISMMSIKNMVLLVPRNTEPEEITEKLQTLLKSEEIDAEIKIKK